MKKKVVLVLVLALVLSLVPAGCAKGGGGQKVVNVFNWGENIDESIFETFQKKTGIKVNYNTYESNEQLYAILKQGGTNYDVIIPSDYMISRLIQENMLEELNFGNIPNFSDIDPRFKNVAYDPQNKYSVPYTWGTMGIIYNTSIIKENIDSWSAMFDSKYAGQILQFDNSRDAVAMALLYLGYSVNTTSETEIRKAYDLLNQQKPLLQAYVMDQIYDKLEGGEAAIGAYYAGDAEQMRQNNPNLKFVIPKEGSNWFIDAMCVPKGAANKANAEAFINFMCSTSTALANMAVTCYATPVKSAYNKLDQETKDNKVMFPDDATLSRCQIYVNLPDETNKLYNDLWIKLKA